jgi:gamma-glutamylcysteine synthetase
MIANAAFWVGLVSALATLDRAPEADLSFTRVRGGFEDAARRGIASEVVWLDGETRPVRDLVLEECLPAARHGLRLHGLPEEEVERWLGIVEQRARTGNTGAAWQLAWVERHGHDFQRMLADYVEHQRSRAPVNEWPT